MPTPFDIDPRYFAVSTDGEVPSSSTWSNIPSTSIRLPSSYFGEGTYRRLDSLATAGSFSSTSGASGLGASPYPFGRAALPDDGEEIRWPASAQTYQVAVAAGAMVRAGDAMTFSAGPTAVARSETAAPIVREPPAVCLGPSVGG